MSKQTKELKAKFENKVWNDYKCLLFHRSRSTNVSLNANQDEVIDCLSRTVS